MLPGNDMRPLLVLLSFVAPLSCESKGSGPSAGPASSAVVMPASSETSSTPAAAAATAKPSGPERGPGHGGVDRVLFRAARELPLSDTQQAKVASLEDQLRDRDTGPRDAINTLSNDLAAQVRSGKIDPAKLQRDEAALDAAMKGMLDKQAKALAGLHDVLDAGQRKALADTVRDRLASRQAGGGDWAARRLEQMTSDLALDGGQQKQVGALLAKEPDPVARRDEANRQTEAIVAAFQAQSFDALDALEPTIRSSHETVDRRIAFTGQLLSLLHPDQREKLAASTAKPAGRGASAAWSSDDEDGRVGNGWR